MQKDSSRFKITNDIFPSKMIYAAPCFSWQKKRRMMRRQLNKKYDQDTVQASQGACLCCSKRAARTSPLRKALPQQPIQLPATETAESCDLSSYRLSLCVDLPLFSIPDRPIAHLIFHGNIVTYLGADCNSCTSFSTTMPNISRRISGICAFSIITISQKCNFDFSNLRRFLHSCYNSE